MVEDAAPRRRRSLLYVPASNGRALEKARSLASDGVIVDLEDSVAPEAKDTARNVAAAAARTGFGGRELAVRCNGLDTPWGQADLAALADAEPDALLAPKVSSAAEVHAYDRALKVSEKKPRESPCFFGVIRRTSGRSRGRISAIRRFMAAHASHGNAGR